MDIVNERHDWRTSDDVGIRLACVFLPLYVMYFIVGSSVGGSSFDTFAQYTTWVDVLVYATFKSLSIGVFAVIWVGFRNFAKARPECSLVFDSAAPQSMAICGHGENAYFNYRGGSRGLRRFGLRQRSQNRD